MTVLLKLSNVDIGYDSTLVVHGLDLEVHEGEAVALLGSNGAGKTTILKCISGLVHPCRGVIEFGGADITHDFPDSIVRRGIVQVQEGRGILTRLTVMENLRMGSYIRKDAAGVRRDLEKVFQIFPVLAQRRNQLGGSLSGGEQQMLAVGRALLAGPKLVMMDEPSLGLAPIVMNELFRVIGDLKQSKTTILLVEQNIKQALKVADRGYVLENGTVCFTGPADALRQSDILIKSYLGETGGQ